MKSLTYGTLPSEADLAKALRNETHYEITVVYGGEDHRNLDAAGLLQDAAKEYGARRLYVSLTVPQLYRLLTDLVQLWDTNDDQTEWAGTFASDILLTLGYEWI